MKIEIKLHNKHFANGCFWWLLQNDTKHHELFMIDYKHHWMFDKIIRNKVIICWVDEFRKLHKDEIIPYEN